MRKGEPGWPIASNGAELDEWICTAGQDCDEGWFEWHTKPGDAPTGQRCACVVKNIRERKRRGAEAKKQGFERAGQW